MLLSPKFPIETYKEAKKKHFSVILENRLGGIPRDSEIAKAAMEDLIKIGIIKNKDDFNRIRQLEFFSKNIFNIKSFDEKLEKLEKRKTNIDLDPRQLKSEQYIASKKDELEKQIIEERSQNIDEQIRQKLAEYESIPSVLDAEEDIPEPTSSDDEQKVDSHDPWWKRVGFTSDPFPSKTGLGYFSDEMIERIIVRTEIFDRYDHYIRDVPTELFKNTIFYGQFGSGKTSFFEYLRIPLIKEHILPIFITLHSEPDYQNFLLNFKKKLCKGLVKIYRDKTAENLDQRMEPMSLEDQITYIFELISKTQKIHGFVVFIDDIYKPPDYEKTAQKFLNYLQTFKTELAQQSGLSEVGFFISAPNYWKSIIKENQEYSGSVSNEWDMPFPTVEEARRMFNGRLAAFAGNDTKYEVSWQIANQVYQNLKSKNQWTFRQFITECLSRFESGNLTPLLSNPILIDRNTLTQISQTLAKYPRVTDGISEILNSEILPINKRLCIELLVQISDEKGCTEDSELFRRKRFHFGLLKSKGLITKGRKDGKTIWSLSKEFKEFENTIFEKFSYTLDNYFIRLFSQKVETKKSTETSDEKYFVSTENLIETLKKKEDKTSSSVRSLLEDALQVHKYIVSNFDKIHFKKLMEECRNSIRLLGQAVAVHSGIDRNTQGFWSDLGYYPESLVVFSKLVQSENAPSEPDNALFFSSYENAFTDISAYLTEQVERDDIFPILAVALKNNEIKEFDNIRADLKRRNYFEAARRISSLVEIKLREFIFSIFLLQYGDYSHRIERIPKGEGYLNFRKKIEDRRNQDLHAGFPPSKNELTYLDRPDYSHIIVGGYNTPYDIGHDNWYRTFSKIFLHWDMVRTRSYLTKFYQYNLRVAHNKPEVFTSMIQPDLKHFIEDSMILFARINQTYYPFLENIKKIQIPGSSELGYYITLDKDKSLVQPVRVTPDVRERLTDTFKLSKTHTIDLSSPCDIEEKYGVSYREVYAILSDLLSQNYPGMQLKSIKKDPILVLKLT